jgi:pimeloyl-ACP methyl ester carboxylesterase
MTARGSSLVVGGTRLETRWIGPGPAQAPTIVMLHEGLGCVDRWKEWPERLAATTGCGVFLYSRAGYGGSDSITLPRPLSYMHDEALGVLPAVLDQIGFERGILLGHSDGASIATIYAGGTTDFRVRGLALLAPNFFVEEIGLKRVERAKADFEQSDLRERLAKYHGTNVDVAFRGWSETWLDPEFRTWDIRESIGYIRVPILIVRGSEDEYGTVAQIEAAREEAYCPVDAVVLPGVGHSPHLDAPDETLAVVSGFVGTLLTTFGEGAMHGH